MRPLSYRNEDSTPGQRSEIAILLKDADRIEMHEPSGLMSHYTLVFDEDSDEPDRCDVYVHPYNPIDGTIYRQWAKQFEEDGPDEAKQRRSHVKNLAHFTWLAETGIRRAIVSESGGTVHADSSHGDAGIGTTYIEFRLSTGEVYFLNITKR